MIPVLGRTPVERQILVRYRDYAAVNASVGAEQIVYAAERREDIERYRLLVARRFASDFRHTYGEDARGASQTYILLERRGTRDVVNVVRIRAPDQDGAFVRLPGLTYFFDPTTYALLDIWGTEY